MPESTLAGDDAPATSETPLDQAPAATEAPAPLSPDPSPEGDPAPQPDGTPRDQHGRFAKRDGEAPASADPAAPTPPLPTTPASATPPAVQPFHYRANGEKHAIPGATYEPGKGLLIPDGPALQHVRQLLASGHDYRTAGQQREAQYRQTIQQLQQAAEQRVGQEDAELAVYKNWFVEILNDPTGDLLMERAQNFNLLAPALKEQARAAKLEKELEAMRAQTQRPQASEAEQQQQLVQSIYSTAGSYLEELKEDGGFTALTPADWKDLSDMVREQPGALLNTSNGEYQMDTQPLRKAAERFKRIRSEAAEQTRATVKATQYNAQRAAPAAPPPKPAPAVRQAAPASDDPDEKYRRQKEWEREVGLHR